MAKRYIDQAALLADMERRLRSLERNEVPEGVEDYAEGVRRGFRLGMSYVRSCEAVDALEVVHAYWVAIRGTNGKDYHKCSNCLHEQEITGVKNYCQICGARMDGRREDDDT